VDDRERRLQQLKKISNVAYDDDDDAQWMAGNDVVARHRPICINRENV